MTRRDKIECAKATMAKDRGCLVESFSQDKNLFFETDKQFFDIVSFGSNAVIHADRQILGWCEENFANTAPERIMDDPNIFVIESKLREYGQKLSGEHIRFLRLNEDVRIDPPTGFAFRICEKDCIHELYGDKRFAHAFNYKNDVIAITASVDGKICSIAAADDNIPGFWQIGIDTLPEYRGKGLAAYLVNKIAREIENRGIIPFYNTWGANIASQRVAAAAGFSPVWVGFFSKKEDNPWKF
ncbi:MAG: GNAT family N-acetyltransferase [Defluviitaleaceae bacterium]|nr:GNAT family N-acetyltransferase [Defluviitaleaceae bacterium]